MATSGLGCLLKRNSVTIAEVQSVSGPGLSLGTVETTHLSSTGGWKEFIATLKEMKAITFTVNFLPAGATHSAVAGLAYDLVQRTLQAFSVTFSDTGATVWSFSAYVTDFDVSGISTDGKLSASVTLRPSGQPTLA